jgi:hypothetical protein
MAKSGRNFRRTRRAGARSAVAFFGLLSGVTSVTALSYPAYAQKLEPGTFAASPQQSDLIAGQNKTGPYTLAWTKIKISLREKVEVILDGRTLPDDAYTIDAAKGKITFKESLKSTSVARISYFYDAKDSKRNGDFTSAPLSLPKLNIGGTNVQLTALSGASTGEATRMVYGADRNLSLLGGGLSSSFLLASASAASSKLGYKYGNDKNGFDAQFQRTEKDFASKVGKSLGVGDALQKLTLGARLRPTSWFGTTVSRAEQKDLNTNVGKEQTAYGLNLGGVGGAPSLNVARTEDATVSAKGDATTVTTDKMDLAAKVGSAALAAKSQKVVTDDPDANKDVTATSQEAGLNLAISKASNIVAKTTKTVTDAPDTAKDVTATSQEAGLNLALGKTSAVTAKSTKTVTDAPDAKKDTEAEEATVALTAATKDKKAQAAVALTTGSKETATGVEEKQNLTIKLQPAPVLTLAAEQKAQKVTPLTEKGEGPAQESVVQSASAELAPLPGTKLVGGVLVSEQGEEKTAATNWQATIGAGKGVEIAGGYTNRSTTVAKGMQLDTTRANVALRPTGGLTLTGGYTVNPEKDGKVSEAVRQEVGLKARLGALELGSGYALTTLTGGLTSITDEPQFGEISVSLGLRFSRFTKLDGGYKDGLLYGGGYDLTAAAAPRAAKVYSLGLSHVVGSAFTFTMGGTVLSDYAKAGTPPAYKAEAKIGARF